MARPVPVLPDVGSMIVPPGRRRPSRSAASISRMATRSLIEPPGLNDSSLATIRGFSPAPIRARRTRGVSPTVSRIESLMSPPTLRIYLLGRARAARTGRAGDGVATRIGLHAFFRASRADAGDWVEGPTVWPGPRTGTWLRSPDAQQALTHRHLRARPVRASG